METPVTQSHSFQAVFQSIVDHAGARLVYGEPVSTGQKTVIPVAKIRYGFGGGSGGQANTDRFGGGGGGGLVANPIGVIEITPTGTRFLPLSSPWTVLAAVAVGVCLGWSVVSLAKG